MAAVEPLRLGELLGSLLSAIVESEAQAARATVDFIREVAFLPDDDGGVGSALRTVRFRYRKLDENRQPADFEAEVPLLAMVSVPSLGVKTARVAFTYDVAVARKEGEDAGVPATPATPPPTPGTPTPSLRPGQQLLPIGRPPVLQGYVRKPSSQSNSTTQSIDVEVTLERGGVPVGLERMLQLAELAIGPPAQEES